tara:strand:+ start:1623 stop:1844 length:222 start_codon:yes stop_codon:yes gene_type:complete
VSVLGEHALDKMKRTDRRRSENRFMKMWFLTWNKVSKNEFETGRLRNTLKWFNRKECGVLEKTWSVSLESKKS